MKYPNTNIHPDAKIAENVTIAPFATIYGDVEIGEGTWIAANVVIMDGARIGKNCKIYPGAVISGDPQDLKYKGEKTLTIIGDNTTIREFATINKGTDDKMQTTVGNNVLVMAYVHIAHDCVVGDNCVLVNGVQLAGHVIVEEFAIIGGTSAVLQFVKIGAHAMIAGGSLVRKDVPPYIRAGREPLSYAGINIIGLRRRGFDANKTAELREIYRLIYSAGLNTQEAIKQIEELEPQTVERTQIIEFIQNAKKGIIRSGNEDDTIGI
jgi:UDP-N-acetylglucosamine acyltransferase